MKIEYMVPCRGIEALADGTFALLGVESNVITSGVPLPQPAGVLFMMCVTQAITDTSNATLRISVLNSEMEPARDPLEIEVAPAPRNPNNPDGWAQRLLLPIMVQFLASSPGPYSIVAALDGASHHLDVHIREQLPE